MGRPARYKKGLVNEICERIANGETLRAICREEEMPSRETIRLWLKKHEEFLGQYAQAREQQQESFADEILEIAHDGSNDYTDKELPSGQIIKVFDQEHVQRSRLRVDTLKWLMSKVAPKKYGERKAIEHSGPDGEPIATVDKTHDDPVRSARIAAVLNGARERRDRPPESGDTGS